VDAMVPYLGPWMAQLTRPDNIERVMPWTICDILRDLVRLGNVVGPRTVRDAVPPKHLQTLANRLVVQGFDKLTPIQLARAAEGFGRYRPFVNRAGFDPALEAGTNESEITAVSVWPSTDWVDELVDWLHNLKPEVEPWPRTSCTSLGVILKGLALSNYKPRQPTFQAAATAVKAKLEEQSKSGYLSRRAIIDVAIAWNIWRVNPEEFAAGFWDAYFKNATQLLEEYVDTVVDPPAFDEDLGDRVEVASGEQEGGRDFRRRPFPQTLLAKRRDFRAMLATLALAAKNFNLEKQFTDNTKAIYEHRVDEHAQFIGGNNARRLLNAIDSTGIVLKPQTREKLLEATARRETRRNFTEGGADRDVDDFDDLRGPSRGGNLGGNRGGTAARGSNRPIDRQEFDDFDAGDNRGARNQKFERPGGSRARRDEFEFDDKPF